jgi:hypothetical protein
MLQETSRRRVGAGDRTRTQFGDELAQHDRRVADAQDARDEARTQRRWWAWLWLALALRRERRRAPRPIVTARRVSDREEIIKAGIKGEDMVAAGLGRALGDDWTLFRGYRNRRGEIDHLLLGAKGLVAIEVKHLNGTVHCDGDNWWSDKYDQYGNLVERGRGISDKRGRSPSMQLNEPAGELEEFLGRRGHPVSIQRVVLLTHPRSKIGNCRNPTVHIGTSTDAVLSLFKGSRLLVEAAQLAELERLILRDHRFHEGRRPR